MITGGSLGLVAVRVVAGVSVERPRNPAAAAGIEET